MAANRFAWVPFHLAVHMVARLLGNVQPWTVQVLCRAANKLVEALQTGQCASEGLSTTTGRRESLSAETWLFLDWYMDSDQLSAGYQIEFIAVCVNAVDIKRKFGTPGQQCRGSHAKLNEGNLRRAYEAECKKRDGTPHDDGPKGWQIQADLERWVTDCAADQKVKIGESAARRYAQWLLGKRSKNNYGPL